MRALIVGIDGQDGYYLTRLLLEKNYTVFGLARKKTQSGEGVTWNGNSLQYHRIYADLNDLVSIVNAIQESQPDEIYNLAGQSEIPLSWRQPILTAQVNALAIILLLEAVRICNPSIRVFQASSSEMFDNTNINPLDETSSFVPRNPYGTAKLFAHCTVGNYRTKYGMYACSGILFNHESPRRGTEFVTQKIAGAVAAISIGKQDILELGDLDSVRDWGYAGDYVRAMWLMLQQKVPKDYIIATGKGHTVRELVECAFSKVGITISWKETGFNEVGVNSETGKILIRINPALSRYQKQDIVIGNPTKLQKELGFKTTVQFEELVEMMVNHRLALLEESSNRTSGII